MLSIPRDLWVNIPGYGENRINTPHFFAESLEAGSGPYLAVQTVSENFGVDIDYFIRFRFESFREIVDSMGGIDIELTTPMAGYDVGKYHLTGRKALAFVRHREGSDDFFRMQQGQFMIKALISQMLKPVNWIYIPNVLIAFNNSVYTNIPVHIWARLAFALFRVGPNGIDSQSISRAMVMPFTTSEGAQVLMPNWDLINPLILSMFDQ